MKYQLYEYAVLLHPTIEEIKAGGKSVVVLPITPVLAGSEKEVVMMATRSIPAKFEQMLDRVEVAVRPF